jgi:hypothetical protein
MYDKLKLMEIKLFVFNNNIIDYSIIFVIRIESTNV